jgi:ribosomal protein L7/L12
MGMSEFGNVVLVFVIVIGVFIAARFLLVMFASGANRDDEPLDGLNDQAKPKTAGVNWAALTNIDVQQHLPDNKIMAIKAYRELTGVGLKEAKDVIEYYLRTPRGSKQRTVEGFSADGLRDLLNEGKFEDAVTTYKNFAGVDYFTARNFIEQMQRQLKPETWTLPPGHPIFDRDVQQAVSLGQYDEAVKLYKLITKVDEVTARDAVEVLKQRALAADVPPDTSGVPDEEVRELLRAGKKIEAVKRVREVTALGLKEALDVVNEIERKLKLG